MTPDKCRFKYKNAFSDETKALSRASKRASIPLRAYKCPDGNHWHLTSEVGTMAKASKPLKIRQWRLSAQRFRAKYPRQSYRHGDR